MNNQSILVTGGAGFVGANLVRLLVSQGARVTVLDNLSAGHRDSLDGLAVDFVQGDILDAALHEYAYKRQGGAGTTLGTS